jgi:hypothetical protein
MQGNVRDRQLNAAGPCTFDYPRIAMKNPILFFAMLVHAVLLISCHPVNDTTIARLNPEPSGYAWWLRIEFRPVHQTVRGIPLRNLDSNWIRATELKKSYIPKELLYEFGRDVMADNHLVFTRSGDFNKDGNPDEALVGVYEDRVGKRGGFILILSQRGDRLEKIHLEQWPGKPGFVALSLTGDNLLVWSCMECDSAGELGWDRTRGRFDWLTLQMQTTPESEAPDTRHPKDQAHRSAIIQTGCKASPS